MEKVLRFEMFPERSLTVLLYRDVTNGGDIKKSIIAGTSGVDAAFANATLVPDLFILHLAAMKALVLEARGHLITRALHSEVVYNLSGSKHISESLKRWGVSEGTTSLLVAKFEASAEEVEAIQRLVKGTQVPVEDLPELIADKDTMKKTYKLTNEELEVGTVADAVAMRIGARDC